jgi:cytochrome c556
MTKNLFFLFLIMPPILVSLALAHSGVNNKDVMARMKLMSDMATNMKIIGQMAKRETAFEKNQAKESLGEIARLSGETPRAFKINANDPKSEAKAEIWADFNAFTKLAERLMADSSRLAKNLETEKDLRPALLELSRSCKTCHSKYRE